uniref:glycosyltransferase family 4 protein n=2 Tax=Oscillatoriophycideae TaxID=1301283 RepID=UPI001F54A7FC|nr:glycosyltransferase family 4 protein [Aerosakkonema funiforme]
MQTASKTQHPKTESIGNTSLRILHVLNDVRQLGNGIINAAIDIACGQAQTGHIVAIASAGGEYEDLLARFGISHYKLDQKRRPVSLFIAAKRFQDIVKEFRPDIVHCHMMTGILLARFLRGSAKYRLVAHIQNVHQRSSVLMGLAERVIPVSDAVAEYMSRLGVPKNKMRVVRNLTLGSPRLPSLDSCTPAPLQQPAIVTVAGMFKRKGIAELISAFAQVAKRFPTAHLYLVGDGDDRAEFENQAAASSVASQIHFEGFQSNPKPYLLAAEVFVLASHRDSCPLVISEARAAGCAIVASNADGIPEQLDYGKSGILVPPGDVTALANAIESILASSAERDKWKQASQQNLERFSVANMVEEISAVYDELLGDSKIAQKGSLM